MNTGQMEKSSPHSLSDKRAEYRIALEEAAGLIVERLSPLPEIHRISVFGSYAKGRRDLFTDLDVLIVMETHEPFVDRLRRLYKLLAVPADMDILCYTPEEYRRMKDLPFFKRALVDEKVLYEKKPA